MSDLNDSAERRLLLIRHAAPEIDPDQPASAWRLSEEGGRECAPLADEVATYGPTRMLASAEPKATETATAIAARLGLPVLTDPDLGEHDRLGVPYLGPDAWDRALARLFAEPDQLVLGRETADAARDRFARAVERAVRLHPSDNLAVVTHGTVLALFVAQHNGLDAMAFWRRLALPALVVLALPGFALIGVPDVPPRMETNDEAPRSLRG
jgi:broad specificity phosphatase PhoE